MVFCFLCVDGILCWASWVMPHVSVTAWLLKNILEIACLVNERLWMGRYMVIVLCYFSIRSAIYNLFWFSAKSYIVVSSLQAGKYVWLTYKEVYDKVMKVGNSIRSCGVNEVSQCLIIYLLMVEFEPILRQT